MRGTRVADVLLSTVQDGEVRLNVGNAVTGTGEVAEAGVWCTPGVYMVPEAPSDVGAAQALYTGEGHAVRVVGLRDNRWASKAGNLVPGDYVAGINSGNARIICKRENESITLYTETDDHSVMLDVNAAEDHIFATCGGSFIQIKPDKVIINGGGCSIEMSGGQVTITANHISLNSMRGNLGVLGVAVPLPATNAILYGPVGGVGPVGVAAFQSVNWVVVP